MGFMTTSWNTFQRNILPPKKTNMAMENPPFEDVFPIENGVFQPVMLVFRDVYIKTLQDELQKP